MMMKTKKSGRTTKVVSISLTPDQVALLDQWAEQAGESRTFIVRQIIRKGQLEYDAKIRASGLNQDHFPLS